MQKNPKELRSSQHHDGKMYQVFAWICPQRKGLQKGLIQSLFTHDDALSIYRSLIILLNNINNIKINQIKTFFFSRFFDYYMNDLMQLFETVYHFFCRMPDVRDKCSKKNPPCWRKALEKLVEQTKSWRKQLLAKFSNFSERLTKTCTSNCPLHSWIPQPAAHSPHHSRQRILWA